MNATPLLCRLGLSTAALVAILGGCAKKEKQPDTTTPPAATETKRSVEPADAPDETDTIIVKGLSTPESVVHDVFADAYLVSNIAGDPTKKDGNGFISKIAPNGEILSLRFIDGSSEEVELHAPKGITIVGDSLAVTDIDTVRFFERESGGAQEQITVPDATFLNDIVALDDDTVIVTDSGLSGGDSGLEPNGSDAIYQVKRSGEITALFQDPKMGNPNGVVMMPDGAIRVVTFGSGQIFDIADGKYLLYDTEAPGQLDGLIMIDDRTVWASSWADEAVYRWYDGEWSVVHGEVTSPADISVDRGRNRLLIPSFMENELWIVPKDLD